MNDSLGTTKMAILKKIWRKNGRYIAIIDLGQSEIIMKEDMTIPPGIILPPKQSESEKE